MKSCSDLKHYALIQQCRILSWLFGSTSWRAVRSLLFSPWRSTPWGAGSCSADLIAGGGGATSQRRNGENWIRRLIIGGGLFHWTGSILTGLVFLTDATPSYLFLSPLWAMFSLQSDCCNDNACTMEFAILIAGMVVLLHLHHCLAELPDITVALYLRQALTRILHWCHSLALVPNQHHWLSIPHRWHLSSKLAL